jgi:anti-sigma B factor antagonist
VADVLLEVIEISSALELATHEGPGQWMTLRVRGEIDLSTAKRVQSAFDSLIESGHRHLIADLDGVSFMDSTGISVLALTLSQLREHEGDLKVVCRQGPARMVLAASGMDSELGVSDELPREE